MLHGRGCDIVFYVTKESGRSGINLDRKMPKEKSFSSPPEFLLIRFSDVDDCMGSALQLFSLCESASHYYNKVANLIKLIKKEVYFGSWSSQLPKGILDFQTFNMSLQIDGEIFF